MKPPLMAVMVAVPTQLLSTKVVAPPSLVMVALPAVLLFLKTTAPPRLLRMVAFSAVLVSANKVEGVFSLGVLALPGMLEPKKEGLPLLLLAMGARVAGVDR